MPVAQTPTGTTKVQVEGLGTVKGSTFDHGVRQFAGIKYANLAKRWTRSQLNTSWDHQFHDGTKLGSCAPNPPEYNLPIDPLLPIPPVARHGELEENELQCLVLNIAAPAIEPGYKIRVMVYTHGGSFLYGGANKPIYDSVNFVSHSVFRNTPVVCVNFNYRVGFGGFLASKAIKADLERGNLEGVGNFGLWDQQVALQWVQHYIAAFGGDPDQVTIYGESAGGMSVSHQLSAKTPATFHRAIAMSGQSTSCPASIPMPHSLEQLRNVPESEVAAATLAVEGVFVATGNPCIDGVFHSDAPAFDKISSPPSWLQSYMVGDVLDEGMIFHGSFGEDTYDSIHTGLSSYLGAENTNTILDLYDITPDLPPEKLLG
ncbi:hypothetical protein ACHAPJ_011832 [Fusarium lateritium]